MMTSDERIALAGFRLRAEAAERRAETAEQSLRAAEQLLVGVPADMAQRTRERDLALEANRELRAGEAELLELLREGMFLLNADSTYTTPARNLQVRAYCDQVRAALPVGEESVGGWLIRHLRAQVAQAVAERHAAMNEVERVRGWFERFRAETAAIPLGAEDAARGASVYNWRMRFVRELAPIFEALTTSSTCVAELTTNLAECQAGAARLRTVLEAQQFRGGDCAECGRDEARGHAATCPIGAALATDAGRRVLVHLRISEGRRHLAESLATLAEAERDRFIHAVEQALERAGGSEAADAVALLYDDLEAALTEAGGKAKGKRP